MSGLYSANLRDLTTLKTHNDTIRDKSHCRNPARLDSAPYRAAYGLTTRPFRALMRRR